MLARLGLPIFLSACTGSGGPEKSTQNGPPDTAEASTTGGPDDTAVDTSLPPPVENRCPAPSLSLARTWGESELVDPSEVTDAVLTGGPGVAVADLDQDGWLDVVMAIPLAPSLIFHNDGTGNLTKSAARLPAANSVSAGDIDGDGVPELFLSTAHTAPDLLMRATGDPFSADGWQSVPLDGPEGESSTASFADLDGDGDLDLAVARWVSSFDLSDSTTPDAFTPEPSAIFRNEDGTLVYDAEALPDAGYLGSPFMLQPVDADGDGDLDLYVSNDFGMMLSPNMLLLNDGSGRFTHASDCSCEVVGFTMGASVGDTDQDGDPDLFITDLGRTHQLVSEGTGQFYDAALANGLYLEPAADSFASWGSTVVDLDLDGWPEVATVFGQLLLDGSSLDAYSADFVEPGWEDGSAQRDRLLWNQGDGTFTDISDSAGFQDTGIGRSVAVGDLNRDGIPDLITAGIPFLQVWMTGGGCGTSITLTHVPPGARVEFSVGGVSQWANHHPATTFSASADEVVLGLAGAAQADSVRVWVGNTVQYEASDVDAGSRLDLAVP